MKHKKILAKNEAEAKEMLQSGKAVGISFSNDLKQWFYTVKIAEKPKKEVKKSKKLQKNEDKGE